MLKLEPRKKELLKMFDDGMSFAEISREINEYEQAVSNLIRKYRDVPKKKPYFIDESYFDKIDSVDKAYFFGLIAADGAIVEQGNSIVLTISLQEEDKYILEEFKNKIKAEAPVRLYKQSYQKKDGRNYKQARFVSANKQVCKSLIAKGIIPRKSNKLGELTKYVEDDFVPDYIRGFFDGNGHILRSITSGVKVKNYLGFSGSYDTLKDIQDWLVNNLNITRTKLSFGQGTKEGTGTYNFRFGAVRDIAAFKESIYHKKIGNLYLKRKLNVFIK